jgi:HEAT repeat protein
MMGLRTRSWLLGMIAVLLFFTYLIFWVQPPKGWASRSEPSVSTMIRALQRKDSRLNDIEVALWRRMPAFVQEHCDSLRPRPAREIRRDACRRLGLLGAAATSAVPCLIQALDDPDLVVRSSAILDIKAIGLPAKGAKRPLLAALKDLAHGSPTNQFLVMEADLVPDALAAIAPRDAEVVSAFLELIAQRNATNQFFMVQAGRVAAALAAMAPRDPKVVSALLELIAHPGPTVWPAPIARAWIEHTPEPLAIFELIRKVLPQRDSWDLVSSVARGCPDWKKRLAVLLSLAEDPDYGIRCHAVQELGALGPLGAGAVPKLTELFGATEKEWEDLPENAQQARFKAYTAFVQGATPESPVARRFIFSPDAGQGQVFPPRPAVVAAAPPAPAMRRSAIRGVTQPPKERVPAFGGLHHRVILALGEIGLRARDAIPLLAREYQDPTSPLRFEAAVARVQVDRDFPEVMPVLAAGLEQAGPELRAKLLARIAQLAGSYDGAVTLLIKALGDSDTEIRLRAFRGLAVLGGKGAPALPVLIAALDDPESEIRLQALRNLGELGSNAVPAVPALIKVLGDPERWVRIQAVASLAVLGDKAAPALPALRQMAWDQNMAVRIMASNVVRTIESATNSPPGGQGSGFAR